MFRSLTNFALDRNWKGAVGFYIFYFVAFLVIAFALGILMGAMAQTLGYTDMEQIGRFARVMGMVTAVIVCPVMTFLVTRAKQIKGIQQFLYLIGTLVLSIIAASFLGMVLPAFLTTRKLHAESGI